MIGPDGDCLAYQWHPVGFVESRGGAAHGGGGRDAEVHQGIGAFFTLDEYDIAASGDGWQVVERTRLRHPHRACFYVPRAVLLAARRVVSVHAGQQRAVGIVVVPLGGGGAKLIVRRARWHRDLRGDTRHHQPVTDVLQQRIKLLGKDETAHGGPQRERITGFAGGEVQPQTALCAIEIDDKAVARITLHIADDKLRTTSLAARQQVGQRRFQLLDQPGTDVLLVQARLDGDRIVEVEPRIRDRCCAGR